MSVKKTIPFSVCVLILIDKNKDKAIILAILYILYIIFILYYIIYYSPSPGTLLSIIHWFKRGSYVT